jgi:hypothetical protein
MLVLLAVALIATSAGAAAGTRTFRPAGAALALDLPADWHGTAPDPGWRFEAVAPRFAGWVFLSVARAVVTNTSFQRSLLAFERRETRKLGPHVRLTTGRTTIGGEPAIAILAAGPGTTTEYIYGFQHGSREYLLVYAAAPGELESQRPAFAASVGSVRFLT